MATIKTSDTRTVIQNVGDSLVDLLNGGTHTGAPVGALAGYIATNGYAPGSTETAQFSLTDTQASQTISSSVGAPKSTKLTLTGTDLQDADQAHATKLAIESSTTTQSFGGGITQTDVYKGTGSAAISVNPYDLTELTVTQLATTLQQTSTLRATGASMKILGTTNVSFKGLEQYGPHEDGGLDLQQITLNSFSTAMKGTHSGAYDGVPFTGSTVFNFAVASKTGLTYDTSTGQLSGSLDSLTFVSTDSTKADGFSDGYEHRYSTTAFTPQMLQALASAALNDTYAARKAALFSGDDTITGVAKQNNYIEAGAGDDSVTGNAYADKLYGDEGNDKLFGLGGADLLDGGAGNDVLDGGSGVDYMVGGDGDDTYILDNFAELGLVNNYQLATADAGTDTLRITFKGGSAAMPTGIDLSNSNLVGVENVQLTGTGVFNVTGNNSNNVLDAGKTASTLTGGLGDDTYYINVKGATAIESNVLGTDTVVSTISYVLGANIENLTLAGKAAVNATGNQDDNILIGNDGANILDGGAGVDSLAGGKGNDTYIVDHANDMVLEEPGAGTDMVKSSVSYALGDNLENLTLTGTAQADTSGTGNELNNIITGDAGANRLDGRGGVDKLAGGDGDDSYFVDLIAKGAGAKATVALEDTVTEKKGQGDNDALYLAVSQDTLNKLASATKATTLTLGANLENLDASNTGSLKLNLTGNAANNALIGNDGDNVLNGGAGNDFIAGGDGDDLIIGGLGTDTLFGGAGADTFSFTSIKDLGLNDTQDVIQDFTSGEDLLSFKGFKGWTFDTAASAATGAKQLWAVVDGGDTIVYGNSGGTLDADFSIKLTGVTTLATSDVTFT
jgi:Ca2+-binding RTX toxin-like protein